MAKLKKELFYPLTTKQHFASDEISSSYVLPTRSRCPLSRVELYCSKKIAKIYPRCLSQNNAKDKALYFNYFKIF